MTVAQCQSSVKSWILQQRRCQMPGVQLDRSWLRSLFLKPRRAILSLMSKDNHLKVLKTRVLMTISSS